MAGLERSDWGEVTPRWQGIRSERTSVCGTSVHLLRADAAEGCDPDAPVHVLLHPLSGSGIFLLDLVIPMTAHGPVIAPDLPGSAFGLTGTPHPRAARVAPNARFVRALLRTLGIRRVVVHGWSMGAAVALHHAALDPQTVAGVVLANPPLPMPLTGRERLAWATLGRLALTVAPGLATAVMAVAGRRMVAAKLLALEENPGVVGLGGSTDGIPADTLEVWKQVIRGIEPAHLRHAITAFADVTRGILVERERTWAAMDAVTAPVLVIAGAEDPLVVPQIITAAGQRRPDWGIHVVPGAGHSVPVQRPEEYAAAVRAWLAEAGVTRSSPER